MRVRRADQRTLVVGILMLAALGAPALAADTDLDRVKQRLLAPLLEPVPATTARRLADSLRPDGSWPQIDYQDQGRSGWKTVQHLEHVVTLARAYRSPESELHGDAALRSAALSSLDYWLRHDFQNPNWWWNQIGVPRALLPALLLLEKELPDEQRRRSLAILRRSKIGMTGQNLVWVSQITAVRGILENDPDLVAAAYRRIAEEIRVTTGEGIQADFSFHQHGPCLYNHGYGAAFVVDCSEIATQVAGTRFAFPAEKIGLLGSLILDGSAWMTRGSATDFGAEGREITRRRQNAGYLATAARNMLEFPTGREAEFRALTARVAGRSAPALVGNRHFWRSDLMAHHRPGYYASARMFSNRVANTDEPCNGEGLKSHHLADGCNLLLRTGREYEEIFPVWDWQKIPGTTVEQRPELTGSPRRMGQTSFVGGVSDGTYGLAAFDLKRDALAARKSWFFFDDEFVCLGAGITCSSGNLVATTLNQCRLSGAVSVAQPSSTQRLGEGNHRLERPNWVWHDETAYLFLEPAEVQLRNEPQQGSWWEINRQYAKDVASHKVFTLWIDHGKRPEDARYSYVVMPGLPLASVAERAARLPIKIVRNDADLQAVRHDALEMAGVVFYRAGRLEIGPGLTVRADASCLVLLRRLADRWLVTLSSPEGRPGTVVLEMSEAVRGTGAERIGNTSRTRIVLDLPKGPDAGKSTTRSFARP